MTPHEFRRRREALNLTRRELGEYLGVSWQAIMKWETGPETGRKNRVPEPIIRLLEYIERDWQEFEKEALKRQRMATQ